MSGQMRTFWTKPADCGHPARYTASSAACSVLPERAAGADHHLDWTTLAHHGMVIVPIGYAAQELFDVSGSRRRLTAQRLSPEATVHVNQAGGTLYRSLSGEYVAGLAVKLNG